MSPTDPLPATPLPATSLPPRLVRNLCRLLAAIGAVFAPAGLALGVYLGFSGDTVLTLGALLAFQLLPMAVLAIALPILLGAHARPGRLGALLLWLGGIGFIQVAVNVYVGIIVVFSTIGMGAHSDRDFALLVGAIAVAAVVGGLAGAAMARAWWGYFAAPTRPIAGARPAAARGAVIAAMGAAALALAVLILQTLVRDPLAGIVVVAIVSGGAWMGLVGRAALRALPAAAP